MAGEYIAGMRYRFHHNDMVFEGVFDGYNDGPEGPGERYVRWANLVVLTPLSQTPASVAQRVPHADTHNTPLR